MDTVNCNMEETAALEAPGDAVDLRIGDADPSEDGQNNEFEATNSTQAHQDAALRGTEDCCQDGTLAEANSAHDNCQNGVHRDAAGDGHDCTPGDGGSAEDCQQNGVGRDAGPNADCQDGPCQDTGTRKDCQGDDPPAKRQKQGDEDISGGDLFFIDKGGGETAEQPPLYTADFISPEDEAAANGPQPEGQPQQSFECFNCGGGHLLYDCPEEIDSVRVAQKRREMARERDAGPKKMRYFEYEMQARRFRPGKLSRELRNALDVEHSELPFFTYRMRILGYPPGWLQDAEIEESGLEIYGLDDKNAEDGEVEEVQYDPTRLISFPGFNDPVPPGVNDRWEEYEMPPMLAYQQRTEAEKYMEAQAANRLAQRKKLPTAAVQPSHPSAVQVVDMNIEDDEIEEGQVCFESSTHNSEKADTGSAGTTPVTCCVSDTLSTPSDTPGTPGALKQPMADTVENGDSANTEEPPSQSPKVNPHKVTLGTPMLLGFSEYTSLPPRENFAKGVSEFIPFENLPGATGRYNKMRQVIDKVRAMRQRDKKPGDSQ